MIQERDRAKTKYTRHHWAQRCDGVTMLINFSGFLAVAGSGWVTKALPSSIWMSDQLIKLLLTSHGAGGSFSGFNAFQSHMVGACRIRCVNHMDHMLFQYVSSFNGVSSCDDSIAFHSLASSRSNRSRHSEGHWAARLKFWYWRPWISVTRLAPPQLQGW